MNKKILKKIIKGCLVLLVLDIMATVLWLSVITKAANFPGASRAQAAMIFFGGFSPGYKGLGVETLRRVNHALTLYREGRIEFFLCSGGGRPKQNAFGADLMKDYLVNQGVPEEKIIPERFSFDTETNWRNSCQLMEEKKLQSLCLVSSPWHLYRIQKIIRSMPCRKVLLSFAPVSVQTAQPSYSVFSIWSQVHYEWLSTLAGKIPQQFYEPLIKVLRNQ